MTGLEYVLVATFAAVWLIPLTLAMLWERQLWQARRTPQMASEPAVRDEQPAGPVTEVDRR